jgi:hypothetical protein
MSNPFDNSSLRTQSTDDEDLQSPRSGIYLPRSEEYSELSDQGISSDIGDDTPSPYLQDVSFETGKGDEIIVKIFNDPILYRQEGIWEDLFSTFEKWYESWMSEHINLEDDEEWVDYDILIETLLYYAELHYKKHLNVELPILYYYERYQNPLEFLPENLQKIIVLYIEKKLGKKLNASDRFKKSLSINRLDFTKPFYNIIIYEWIYFKDSPTGISGNGGKYEYTYHDDNPPPPLEYPGYKWFYFMWINPDDKNLIKAPEDKVFTPSSMTEYNLTNHNFGWTTKQIKTYYNATIVPYILQKYLPEINPNHSKYQSLIKRIYPIKRIMVYLIKHFLQNNNLESLLPPSFKVQELLNSIETRSEPLTHDELNHILFSLDKRYVTSRCIYLLLKLKTKQMEIKKSLQEKILRIRTRVEQQDLPGKYKYKWERMCAKLTKLDLEDLRELALVEGIAFVHMKSKRELCKELYEKLDRMVANLNTYSKQCQNDFSVLTSDNVPKTLQEMDQPDFIKSQYLFTYKHNGLVYCDDIRALYKYINETGKVYNRSLNEYEYMHPDTRSPLSQANVRAITREYNNLVQKIISLHDENDETTQLTPQQILSTTSTDFVSKLPYPKDVGLYINSDQDKFEEFISALGSIRILSQNEITNIQGDLISRKIELARLLLQKIEGNTIITSDGGAISQSAYDIREIYNETF